MDSMGMSTEKSQMTASQTPFIRTNTQERKIHNSWHQTLGGDLKAPKNAWDTNYHTVCPEQTEQQSFTAACMSTRDVKDRRVKTDSMLVNTTCKPQDTASAVHGICITKALQNAWYMALYSTGHCVIINKYLDEHYYLCVLFVSANQKHAWW